MTTYRKKLIEVALPLEAINVASKEDKDRKTGTIRNLHKWFAPMPVPALRAVIAASLLNAPADEASMERALSTIERLVRSSSEAPPETVLTEFRTLLHCQGSELPPVLDPFCGGGSTLVEAQRLGLRAIGSDLNPIPVLISKVLTEFPPGLRGHRALHDGQMETAVDDLQGFISDARHYAAQVYARARAELEPHYPVGPNGDPVVAWMWARTVPSPDPRFQGKPTPLAASWWLSKQPATRAYISPTVDSDGHVSFEIASDGDAPPPSKSRCLLSGAPISFSYVRDMASRGQLSVTMTALVTQGRQGRKHFPPTEEQLQVASQATPTDPPLEELPEEALSFRVQRYGFRRWADLFLPRQLLALETFSRLVADVPGVVKRDGGSDDLARAIGAFLALCVGKVAQFHSQLATWYARPTTVGKVERAFTRHDVPMTWDFPEANPFAGGVGDWMRIVDTSLRAFDCVPTHGPQASVMQLDARAITSAVSESCLVVTDPPYFSSIGYADLSDYFYIWIRRAVGSEMANLFATIKSPKSEELIAAPARHSDAQAAKRYFIDGFTTTFARIREVAHPEYPILVVYAFKEQESVAGGQASSGWEAMLEAMLAAGLAITATWPIRGTGSSRMINLVGGGANALATYVLLVARARAADATPATRRTFIEELRRELPTAVDDLTAAAIAPVDLAQAVIGPGMAIFSRHTGIVEADGGEMRVRDALLIINQVLDELLNEREADFDSATRWAVSWYEEYGVVAGPFGEADALARAKVTATNALVEAGLIEAKSGRVRLLPREELPATWDPRTDQRPTTWEVVQHMIRTLQTEGDSGAAELLRRSGGLADGARELAYRLYAICERKGWAQEALGYNALVVAWPEISRLAAGGNGGQQTLGV